MNIPKLKYFLALTLTLGLFNIDIVAQDAEEDVEEVIAVSYTHLTLPTKRSV